jgi:hypothetical protein
MTGTLSIFRYRLDVGHLIDFVFWIGLDEKCQVVDSEKAAVLSNVVIVFRSKVYPVRKGASKTKCCRLQGSNCRFRTLPRICDPNPSHPLIFHYWQI